MPAGTFFTPSAKTPDELLFSSPQYNTWIELMYDQNQAGILKYAEGIKGHGFPAGVLMVDDNWQEDYGKWDFNKGRFSTVKAMIATLHADGFKVMLWVCPLISPDCDVYRDLAKQNLLVEDYSGEPAIVRWRNGASALLDFTNPKAAEWFGSGWITRNRAIKWMDSSLMVVIAPFIAGLKLWSRHRPMHKRSCMGKSGFIIH